MTYEDFRSRLLDTLTVELGAEVQPGLDDVASAGLSGSAKEACVLQIPNRRLSPVIYPDYFYQKYTNGSSFEEIVENVKDAIRYTDEDSFDFDEFSDYQVAKKHLVPRLINLADNQEMLEKRAYAEYLNLAVIFTYVISSESEELVTFTITNDQLSGWKVSKEQIFRDSIKSARKIMPYTIDPIRELLPETYRDDPSNPFYVLTNTRKQYGAACVLYDHVLSDFADQIGENFYLIPSSVHEMLLLPESLGISPWDMEKMLIEVNSAIVKPEEVLSDKVYYFDKETGKLDYAEKN
ncbi:MAG: hypothetical protein DUD27_02285 [Lachnospiraceae bacterium]|uniref:DUF1444 family protein n=1 Tax=Candidatus Weimeria bifida TaxID=2599074 RepID=A0A6N7J0G5_9FIRM|nr:hypothetical protein [Candidatus Weimeria bifida]RRF97086.1 MAG: hypothetical protein DUD27_02285 [Lachnospiraceae bacterium]